MPAVNRSAFDADYPGELLIAHLQNPLQLADDGRQIKQTHESTFLWSLLYQAAGIWRLRAQE